MKKQYVKPEIEVYDLEDVPMVLCSSPGVNYDGNINKPSSSSDIEYEDAVALLHLQSRQSSVEKSKTPTSNICTFSDK